MSNWSEEQERQRETKAHKAAYKDKIGGFFLDLSKLSFAGMVIGGLISIDPADISFKSAYMILGGLVVTSVLGRIGNNFIR